MTLDALCAGRLVRVVVREDSPLHIVVGGREVMPCDQHRLTLDELDAFDDATEALRDRPVYREGRVWSSLRGHVRVWQEAHPVA